MFKEILKIIPQVENRDLKKMERSLGRRFTRIARKFGKVLTTVLTKGSLVGLGLALINRIVNPLQAVQESIDRILKQGDDLVTFAQTFNTTAGKLAKLTAFGEATGLDRDFLFQLLSKFQGETC
jgi:methyl-accepting chemotaxis protein